MKFLFQKLAKIPQFFARSIETFTSGKQCVAGRICGIVCGLRAPKEVNSLSDILGSMVYDLKKGYWIDRSTGKRIV